MEHRNNEEISDLRQSEKKLELENKRLRDNIKELRGDMAVLRQVKDEVDAFRRLVQTMESNVEANEVNPLQLKSKNYSLRKMDDSNSFAHRCVHDIFSNIHFPRSKKQTLLFHHLVTVVLC